MPRSSSASMIGLSAPQRLAGNRKSSRRYEVYVRLSIAAIVGRIRFPIFAPFFVRKDDWTVRSATLGGESQKQPTLRSIRRVAILFSRQSSLR
ncbi:hypothetical protein ACQKK5_13740 [Brevibacillus panacihumi]|uniref:hypothetical protein n=1 Tax=Brevibacillus panacihumi TaxID=497735 RepID=UPI003D017D5C